MKFCFKVDGVDFSDVIAITGMDWNMVLTDSEDSGRNDVDWSMERPVVAEGRQITFTGHDLVPYTRFHALALAVRKRFFDITYLDVADGLVTKTFFNGELGGKSVMVRNGEPYYSGIKLTVTTRDLTPI